MPLRLLELYVPEAQRDRVRAAIEDHSVAGFWVHSVSEDRALVRVLLAAEETEHLTDILEERFRHLDEFRLILLPVEATLPRPEEPEEKVAGEEEHGEPRQARVGRVSREELYADVTESTKLTPVYVVLVALSTVVAAAGILQDSVPVIIGAMVIAPLLGPNIAAALATTLADAPLARLSVRASLVGLTITLLLALLVGYTLEIDPAAPQIASRTRVGLGDVTIALASGGAGALAFTTGISTGLIGVMVAVALLPPVVVFGLLLGSGFVEPAVGALLIGITNLICINLAGVVTFVAQGVRPRTWWEADRAKKATRIALALWTGLLAALIAVIYLSQA